MFNVTGAAHKTQHLQVYWRRFVMSTPVSSLVHRLTQYGRGSVHNLYMLPPKCSCPESMLKLLVLHNRILLI